MILRDEVAAALAEGESFAVEFKRDADDDELVEAALCLANGDGGWLLVGVEDDGAVVGARPRHGTQTDPARVEALVANRTVPPLSTEADVVDVGGRPVLAVHVPKQRTPVGTSKGLFLRRALGHDGKPQCLPFHAHEMASRLASMRQVDPSAAPVPGARWEDLDPLEFERARRVVRANLPRGDQGLAELGDLDLARALSCVETNGDVRAVTLAGLLLFGREQALQRLVPTHEVAFQELNGEAVRVNDFVRWPLIRVSEGFSERLAARHREEELRVGLFRVPIPEYDLDGLREALHNAVTHRDYARLGAVHVQRREDRVEVSNPGGFPEGVRLDNLLVVPPTPRNLCLADAFKRLGLVERTGRGVDMIFSGCLRYGRPAPDYADSTETAVKVTIPGGAAHLAFARLVVEHGNKLQRSLSVDELLILREAREQRRVDAPTAAQLIQKGPAAARATLETLAETGLLEPRGERRGRVWHLSAAVYRALGQPAAYVRTRGFDDERVEWRILQLVEAHGSVSRSEAAEACGILPRRASYLLRKLVLDGRLKASGSRRWTRYVPAQGHAEVAAPSERPLADDREPNDNQP